MNLTDEFGARTVTVRQPKRICNPADKNDEDPDAPDDPGHLIAYNLSDVNPGFARVRNQVVVNQFGSITVDVVRPDLLLVPSAKSLSGPPPPLPANSLDHFLCYQTKGGRTRVNGVRIDDEFGSITVNVKRPVRLCVPVDKNGEGIPDPSAYVMCYDVKIRSSSGFAPAGTVFVNNQFGTDSFESFRARELCIPSVLNRRAVNSGPSCGDGLVNVAGEQCDPPSDTACPGLCQPDCTCASGPTCGDGSVNQPTEQCDSPDDDACPGQCQDDCMCPEPTCGDGSVNQPSEQCDAPDDSACPGLCAADCSCGN